MPTRGLRVIAAITAIAVTGVPAVTAAQDREPIDVSALGPQVGEQVPAFELPDQQGRKHTLETVRGPNGSLILFHRSADW